MSETGRERLDNLLVELGLAPTRNKAQAMILAGIVLVNDMPVTKAGTQVSRDAPVRIKGQPSRFVGRGGDKIDPLFDHFDISLKGIVALDVGASTGGFTDAMLQRGAQRVYAVDVGYNQLDLQLRRDPRVVVMERTHVRDLPSLELSPRPSLAVVDLSFISLRKVLEPIVQSLQAPFSVLCLVKPQFELEREDVGKGGVVRDKTLQLEAVSLVEREAARLGLTCLGSAPAALKGDKKGNQEYFLYIRSSET